MIFGAFKEFRYLVRSSIEEVAQYLSVDLTKTFRELQLGLTRLRFTENFEAFEVQVTIAATSELEIRNQLRSQSIPTQRIIVRGGSDSQNIVDGDTEWTREFVYLKNTGATSVTATVVFLR